MDLGALHKKVTDENFIGHPLSVLELENFRNLVFERLLPHPRLNFFFGDNAQGKTSILEAIYFLSELKSFRCQDLAPLVQHEKQKAFLRAEFSLEGITYDLKSSLSANSKEIYLNGKKPRPYSKLRQILPIVLFTPDSIRLFRVAAGERRTYFDRFFSLLSEDYETSLENYQSVLKQKLSLLELARESGHLSKDQMEVWDEKLKIWGAKLSFARFEWTRRLSEKLASYFKSLSGGKWEVDLKYEPYFKQIQNNQDQMQIEALISAEIQNRKQEELERAQVLVGPHRDDWTLWLGEQKLKEEGSQGQHRVSVAALKLSEVALLQSLGKNPIALFDDLLSELDLQRSRQMLETLSECDCQVFLTSVTPLGIPLKGLEGIAFELKQGQLFQAFL